MKFVIFTAHKPEGTTRTFYSSSKGFCNVMSEEYNKSISDPIAWGKDIIKWFNSTCKSGERKRVFLGAKILSQQSEEHNWEKSCLVTQSGGYDTYKCTKCSITGKRYGLSSTIIRDPKFKADKYKECHT